MLSTTSERIEWGRGSGTQDAGFTYQRTNQVLQERHMGQNVGAVDRVIRFAVGLFLLSLTIFGPRTPWGILGLIPLTTSILGFCPFYRLVGITSREPYKRAL